ncbi:MAG: O-methyltransferase [Brevinematales bacterium]|jgi:caffeoyl-CoA O-methyltransferase
MEITVDLFKSVDGYISERVGTEDEILKTVRASCKKTSMPDAAVSPVQGKFLQVLARACGSKKILEIGTLAGYSTVWLARAMDGSGKLITIEYDKGNWEIAKENIRLANLDGIVQLKNGRALDILPEIMESGEGPFDFIFIDADKPPYVEYLNWAIKLSGKGTVIVLDNIIRKGEILNRSSEDPKVLGTRRLNDYLKECTEADFSIIQTAGEKGYDGMAIGVVK